MIKYISTLSIFTTFVFLQSNNYEHIKKVLPPESELRRVCNTISLTTLFLNPATCNACNRLENNLRFIYEINDSDLREIVKILLKHLPKEQAQQEYLNLLYAIQREKLKDY